MSESTKEELMAWWVQINTCWANTKNGKRCRNKIRKGYVAESGELIVFFTCLKHWTQENKIRKQKGLSILAYALS